MQIHDRKVSTLKTQKTRASSKCFNKFEYFFNGTIGTWSTAPVDLELEDDANIVFLRPYPVHSGYEAMFRKEFNRLVKLWVLKKANNA